MSLVKLAVSVEKPTVSLEKTTLSLEKKQLCHLIIELSHMISEPCHFVSWLENLGCQPIIWPILLLKLHDNDRKGGREAPMLAGHFFCDI